jgi:hypothetical protein
LWAVRYEQSALVRAAACHAMVLLEQATNEIIDVLQNRLLVEKETIVVQ